MSIYVSDATAPNLADGTAFEIDWPCMVQVTAESATGGAVDLSVEGCETEDFTTADVVTFGTIVATLPASATGDAGFELRTEVNSKYVRVTDNGTAPADLVVTVRPLRYHWAKLQSAAPLA